MLHKAVIAGLTMDPATNTPIVILKTEEGDQAVPIWNRSAGGHLDCISPAKGQIRSAHDP